jgi:hypothetical protein
MPETTALPNALAEAQKAQVMTAMYALDNAGLHGIDESVAAGTVPAGSPGAVRRVLIVTRATMWPAELQETTSALAENLAKLQEALRDEDVERAKDPAHEAHELGHQLSDQVYTWLGNQAAMGTMGDAGMPAMADEAGHDH